MSLNIKILSKKKLHTEGAILFRGFAISKPENFKKAAMAFTSNLMRENGEHTPLSDTDMVYTPVAYSPKKKLLWHSENSFNKTWPLIIMFCCTKPADSGGETPIVDNRAMLRQLASDVVEEFAAKGVMYVRAHGYGIPGSAVRNLTY